MDEKQCARIVLRNLREPAALDVRDDLALAVLADRITADIFAVVKMEHDLGWVPPGKARP